MQPFELTFIPTAEEYVAAYKKGQRKTIGVMILVIAVFVITGVTAILNFIALFHTFTLARLLLGVGLPLLVAGFFYYGRFVVPLRSIRRRVAARDDLTTVWRFSPEQIEVITPFEAETIFWPMFTQLASSPDVLVLFYLKDLHNYYRFIPRRVFETAQDEADFLALLKEKTGLEVDA